MDKVYVVAIEVPEPSSVEACILAVFNDRENAAIYIDSQDSDYEFSIVETDLVK